MAMNAAQASAKNLITTFLTRYGLGSLSTWAWNKYLDGASVEQLMLEVRDTKEYKTRFPAMDALSKAGRAITEQDYINFERGLHALVQQYGIPVGMYDDPAGVSKLLTNDVSLSEINSRLQLASTAAFSAPPEVRDSLRDTFGVNLGDLTAYYLDPDKALPLLTQRFVQAQIQGASVIQGVGTGLATAERLAAQGVDFGTALEGFANVRSMRSFTTGYGEVATREQTEEAAFGSAAAESQLSRIARGRAAPFQAGGGAVSTQTGVAGLGSAQTP